MKPEWIRSRTVLAVVHGSRSYGLDLPGSDTDIKGICVPPASYIYGIDGPLEQVRHQATDTLIWEIQKFFRNLLRGYLAEAEVCCTSDEFVVLESEEAKAIRNNAICLIDSRIYYSYIGAAKGNHREIMREREALEQAPEEEPLRSEYMSQRSFNAAWKLWDKKRKLEPYNSKKACHVIRCLRMATALARTGWIPVHEPGEDLLRIRKGLVPFEEYLDLYRTECSRAEDASIGSSLPDTLDVNRINRICENIVRSKV